VQLRFRRFFRSDFGEPSQSLFLSPKGLYIEQQFQTQVGTAEEISTMSFSKQLPRFLRLEAAVYVFEICLAALPCFGQCIQPASRTFGPYAPAPGSKKTLQNPLLDPISSSSPGLKIVTLGDSVVWGDGNLERNKFSVKLARDLANATGRATTVVEYAHSGARLVSADDPASLVPTDGSVYQMDLNSQRPTTAEQADCAASRDSDAEVVLLDGCINEVGATKIALPSETYELVGPVIEVRRDGSVKHV
jgi:hypothetical protein